MSIIGKKYIPKDNSYCVCLSDNPTRYEWEHTTNLLAPCMANNMIGKECVILTNPFTMNILSIVGEVVEQTFVIVNSENKTYFVLFSAE